MRRERMQRSRTAESHVLPRKYREPVSGHAQPLQQLEECKRIMLYTFKDSQGFASELNALLTAAVIAQRTSRVLLVNDVDWNYGALTDYFLPRKIFCHPPKDWFLPERATAIGSKRWSASDRVAFDKSLQDHADDWVRDEMLDATLLDRQSFALAGVDAILPEGQTLLPELEELYADYHTAVRDLWRPNHEIARMIRELRIELGLGDLHAGLRQRKHSPTFGHRRRQSESAAEKKDDEREGEEDEDELEAELHAVAERRDRVPVIGVHVRLGDKASEHISDMRQLGTPNISFGNVSALARGASDAFDRLSRANAAMPAYSRSRLIANRFNKLAATLLSSGTGTGTGTSEDAKGWPIALKPKLVVMSAERDAVERLSREPTTRLFAVQPLRGPSKEALLRWADILKIDTPAPLARRGRDDNNTTTYESDVTDDDDDDDDDDDPDDEVDREAEEEENGIGKGEDVSSILTTFEQATFNKLPRSLRVFLTKHFVRDLTVMALHADAFVVTSTSNVGRLACVLAGEEAVVGPRSLTPAGPHYGGRVRSIDAPWHPTRKLSTLFS